VCHKARLVAKGYVQRQGIDYEEVFTPVACMEAVRLLLTVVAWERWQVHHMDVKTTFLNGELQEEVFVDQPPSFIRQGHEHKVLRLHKALYGLYQTPRAWNKKLDEKLGVLGFMRCESEHAFYCRGARNNRLIVGVYVDDLIITGPSIQRIGRFKLQMANVFKMSDLGLLTHYMGIEVKQSRERISCLSDVMLGRSLRRVVRRDGTHVRCICNQS
jgi:hypothetical protein